MSVKFLLSGALAQFSRSGLVKDVADHLTRIFAQNLEARLSGRPAATVPTETLDAGAGGTVGGLGSHPRFRRQDVRPLGSGCLPSNAQESGNRGKQLCWKKLASPQRILE